MQCNQSLERDPVAVTESEKEQRCYAICCANMSSGCGKAFTTKALANGLSDERFKELGAKNIELGVHLILPDAVKEHLAAAAASGQATREQHEKCIRDAYRRSDGTFRTERGELVRQCSACSFGPIIAQINCGDMRAHDGEVRGRHVQNNRCLHCGHLNQGHYESWPTWDGVHVLGSVPSLVHGDESVGRDGASAPAAQPPVPAPAAVPPPRPRVVFDAPPLRRAPGLAAAAPTGEPLAVGDRVRVRASVARPTYGWGSVSHATVGTLTRIYGERGERCDVNFPRSSAWMGRVDEMERAPGEPAPAIPRRAPPVVLPPRSRHPVAGLDGVEFRSVGGHSLPPLPDGRRLRVGDRVRVRADVRTPTYQWGGSINHASVGVIERIYGERNERCDVRFPERASSWLGLLEEMERVDGSTATAAARAPTVAPAEAPAARRMTPSEVSDADRVDDQTWECLQCLIGMGFEMEAALRASRRTASVHNMESRISQTSELLLGIEAA